MGQGGQLRGDAEYMRDYVIVNEELMAFFEKAYGVDFVLELPQQIYSTLGSIDSD